jgi:hypothetical protein
LSNTGQQYIPDWPIISSEKREMFAGIFKSKPSPSERITEALAECVEDIADQARNGIGSRFRRPSTDGALKTAAALATKAATAYLRNKLSRAFKGRDA